MIQGEKIFLRKVELSDAKTILAWENNPAFWHITETPGPFSLREIQDFINHSSNLTESGQIRYMIFFAEDNPIGAVDLFDYNPISLSAGIGVLIANEGFRSQGFATDAIRTLIQEISKKSCLKELNCIIYPDNLASIRLFSKLGFKKGSTRQFKGADVFHYSISL